MRVSSLNKSFFFVGGQVIKTWTRYTLRRRNAAIFLRLKNRPRRFFLVLVWNKNVLKTELFENDSVMIIMTFLGLSFSRAQIQKDR